MTEELRAELLLQSWVSLSGILKNTRITKGLAYNEAIIMLMLYKRYRQDGEGLVSIREITVKTNMLKSLVNRTVNSLEEKGLLERCDLPGDKRMSYVKCVKDKLDVFLEVHTSSLDVAHNIINIIGTEDTEAFIRIVRKIESSGYSL